LPRDLRWRMQRPAAARADATAGPTPWFRGWAVSAADGEPSGQWRILSPERPPASPVGAAREAEVSSPESAASWQALQWLRPGGPASHQDGPLRGPWFPLAVLQALPGCVKEPRDAPPLARRPLPRAAQPEACLPDEPKAPLQALWQALQDERAHPALGVLPRAQLPAPREEQAWPREEKHPEQQAARRLQGLTVEQQQRATRRPGRLLELSALPVARLPRPRGYTSALFPQSRDRANSSASFSP
jgi:hypothetical protein